MTRPALTAREARVLLDNLAHADASKLPPGTWETYTAAKRKLIDIELAGVRQHLEVLADALAAPSTLERAA